MEHTNETAEWIHLNGETNRVDVNYLMKRFAEEKAAWESNEQEVVEAAIESVSGELEAERKLRRRFEGLNKKLGKELAETKAALMKAVNVKEEVEKEREMLQLADALREEKVQMKHPEAKHHQLEEKNEAVDKKLRNKLQTYLRAKRCIEKQLNNQESEEYLNHQVVEDENEEDTNESDLHLNVVDNKSLSLQRSISYCVDWVVQSEKLQKGGDDGGLDWGRSSEGYLGGKKP